MYKRKSILKLGRTASHRGTLVKNLVRSVFTSGYMSTTTSKAKVLRGEVLSLLASVKRMDEQSAIRYIKTYFTDRKIVDKVVEYAKLDNNGVSIVKVGFRPGDNSEKSKVSLMNYEFEKKGNKLGAKSTDDVKKEKKVAKVKTESKGKISVNNKASKVKAVTVKKERARTRAGI